MSTVNGAARSAGPRPAAQPRTSVSRATASSWRTLDHLNARSHVPIVDGARVSSNNSGAAPARSTSTSSMLSPPASIAPTTVTAFAPQKAAPGPAASFTRASTSPAMPRRCTSNAGLVDARVKLAAGPGAAFCGAKAVTVVGAMLAGGDSIDDVDVLRAGAAPELFDDTRAPSTIGTWLRAFKWSNVRQLDAVARETLVRGWAAGLGPADLAAPLTVDIDSSVCQTYGVKKQGAKFGYTKVRGYHPVLATCADTGEVLHARMRGGNAASARGAKTFTAETLSRVAPAGATGELTVRADSAFYSRSFIGACRTADARFSVTVRMNTSVRAAIDALPESAWTPIPYWLDGGADVAEVAYTAFASSRRDAVQVRLIVRRVRPTPGSQLALDVVFDHHALVTDRTGDMLELEADHRAHARVELVIRDLKDGPLAHLPSGVFTANAA